MFSFIFSENPDFVRNMKLAGCCSKAFNSLILILNREIKKF